MRTIKTDPAADREIVITIFDWNRSEWVNMEMSPKYARGLASTLKTQSDAILTGAVAVADLPEPAGVRP